MPSLVTIFPFDGLAQPKTIEKINRAFLKHHVEPVSIEAVPGTKRTSGVSYRELQISFADSQIIKLRIKQTGDIFQVLQNGRALPIKNQQDHSKAVIEIIDALDVKRAAFQKALKNRKIKPPASIKTATPKMLETLTKKRDDLIIVRDGLRETLAELKSSPRQSESDKGGGAISETTGGSDPANNDQHDGGQDQNAGANQKTYKKPKPVVFSTWSNQKVGNDNVGGLIKVKGKYYVISKVNKPEYYSDDAMSFGAPGGMDRGWRHSVEALELPPVDIQTTQNSKEKLSEIFDRVYKNGESSIDEAMGYLGKKEKEFNIEGGKSVAAYENGVATKTYVYDMGYAFKSIEDKKLSKEVLDLIAKSETEAALSSKEQEYKALNDLASRMMTEWGVDKDPQTIPTETQENKNKDADTKPKPAVQSGNKFGKRKGDSAGYKGRQYTVGYSGATKFGHRTKLVMSNGREFWVDTKLLDSVLSGAIDLSEHPEYILE